MLAAAGKTAALFGLIVVLGDGPFAVAFVAAPRNVHDLAFKALAQLPQVSGVGMLANSRRVHERASQEGFVSRLLTTRTACVRWRYSQVVWQRGQRNWSHCSRRCTPDTKLRRYCIGAKRHFGHRSVGGRFGGSVVTRVSNRRIAQLFRPGPLLV